MQKLGRYSLFVLVLLLTRGISADTTDDLSLMVKELRYLEQITHEMKDRNAESNQRIRFSYERLAARIRGIRVGVEEHLDLVQTTPKWDRLGLRNDKAED